MKIKAKVFIDGEFYNLDGEYSDLGTLKCNLPKKIICSIYEREFSLSKTKESAIINVAVLLSVSVETIRRAIKNESIQNNN